ncbi:hypothetical protein ACQY0O_007580 [Thecaphora frezii]
MSPPQPSLQSGATPAPATVPAPTAGFSRRFFHEDVVRLKIKEGASDSNSSGVVLRCWQREEAEQQDPVRERSGKNRPLQQGEIGVFWSPSDVREILKEDEVEVVDRSLHIGDVCKKSLKDKSSCVVVDIKRKLTLEHVISKKRIDHEVPSELVQNAVRITRGDYVVAQDWIGVVEEIFEEALVESSDSTELVKVCDVGSSLPIGEVRPETYQESYYMWESQFPSHRIPSKMTIIDVRQTVLYVNWLAMNQTLSPSEQDQRPRPKKYWTTDMDQLTLVRSFSDSCQAVGDRVIFRSEALAKEHGVEPTRHGSEGIPVDVLHVVHTSTKVDVIWQNGTRSEEDARTLIPYINIDEYESWPGDWVWWQGEGSERKSAIVQAMDPEERTAEIRIYGTDTIETVPVLELNVHGTDPDTFGIHRGDVVMIDRQSHSMPLPALPRVGQGEDIPTTAKLHAVLGKKGIELSRKHPRRTPLCLPRDPKREAVDIDWYGTVTGLHLDGGIVVKLPSGTKVVTQLEKLSLLSEGYDDEYMDEDGMSIMDEEYGSEWEEDEAAMWIDEDGQLVVERDDWEDVEVDDGVIDIRTSTEAPTPQIAEIIVADEQPAEQPVEHSTTKATEQPATRSAKQASEGAASCEQAEPAQSQAADAMVIETPAVPAEEAMAASSQDSSSAASLPVDDARWSRFEVLESAPQDHAFIKEPSASMSSGAYFKRIQKEFKVLQTSLPESILVRSYEDRTDLLRVLIIGSEGTPYEDAPFVIDFHLKPSYPQEPPVAHFHSWTNGSGRVSPNLYEEGKVCLSILGTWSGQESESWSPTKSSLLQVFVSIQGLVLVREPWFTEPAYEKLKGTEEGEVNSALYSEKAFVLARGFVRRALEQPPEGLKEELEYLYYGGEGKGRLQKVMRRCNDLIAEAEEAKRRKAAAQRNGNGEGDGAAAEVQTQVATMGAAEGEDGKGKKFDDAISHISTGSCIVLKRHLTALQKLWQQRGGA